LEQTLRDVQTQIEDTRDQIGEEEDRNRELQLYKNSNLTIIQDLKKALDREISTREALEEAKKLIEKENRSLNEEIEQEKLSRTNMETHSRKIFSELEDYRSQYESVSSQLEKSEKAKRQHESGFYEIQQKISDLTKRTTRDGATKARLESERKNLKTRVVEEQERAAQAESQKRKSEVEISKLKDDLRTFTDDLDRSKGDLKQAFEEKRELEDRAKSVSGLWK